LVFPRAELPAVVTEDVCSQYNIQFDTSSLEQIFYDPESILADPEQFLATDHAYGMFARHRDRVNDPFSQQAWLREIEGLASETLDDRMERVPFRLYELVMEYQQSFCQEVVDLVLAHLPEGTNLQITVYLTAYEGSAAAYTMPSEHQIAFNLSHLLMANTAVIHEATGLSAFFNLALHEFFHAGYGENMVEIDQEEHRRNEIVIDIVSVLQNEGIACHISKMASKDYPTPFEVYVYLIDSELVVKYFLGEINQILADGSPPPPLGEEYNDLYRRIGKIGYRRQGLYILGGYMAQQIEEQLGAEALVQTIEDGFFSFVDTYNSIVEEDMRVVYTLVEP
jgi:hypothetical protein